MYNATMRLNITIEDSRNLYIAVLILVQFLRVMHGTSLLESPGFPLCTALLVL